MSPFVCTCLLSSRCLSDCFCKGFSNEQKFIAYLSFRFIFCSWKSFLCVVLCSAFIFKLSDFCRSFFLCCVRVCAFVDCVCFGLGNLSVCNYGGCVVQNL